MTRDAGVSDAELLASEDLLDAFGLLFDRHAKAVYNHCFRLTADWSAAEDLTSVVFLVAWRRRRSVVLDGESIRPWLLGVAGNVVRNHARTLRRYRVALGRLPIPAFEPDPADDVAARVDDERKMRSVLAQLSRLPATQRDVVVLCLGAGLSYREAAVALGVPIGTVRSRLARARASLGHGDDDSGCGRSVSPSARNESTEMCR